jgi:Domain of unknown function (DUF4386)
MGYRMTYSRLIGALFIAGFVVYGAGFGLQMSLGLGALFLCLLLFRTRLVPQWLAGWGVIGYALHVAGAIAEIFGIPISLIILIPGGLFELALAFWLLIKGFNPEAYARGFQPEAYGGHAEAGHAEVLR